MCIDVTIKKKKKNKVHMLYILHNHTSVYKYIKLIDSMKYANYKFMYYNNRLLEYT